MTSVVMRQYVLYKNPSDYPGKYVLREWHIVHGSPVPVVNEKFLLVSPNRETIESFILPNPNLFWLPRSPQDDPCIEGTWI